MKKSINIRDEHKINLVNDNLIKYAVGSHEKWIASAIYSKLQLIRMNKTEVSHELTKQLNLDRIGFCLKPKCSKARVELNFLSNSICEHCWNVEKTNH